VIGVLRGRDRAAETVVYTAHHDHLGIGPAIDGDNIYNGALDDAIGVAGVIEIARAFVALPQRPRRSIMFLAVTAEEKGLLGSDYFAAHPTVPLRQIAADINLDGLNPQWEPHDVIGLGAEHSTLAAHVATAARVLGFAVSEDPEPDQISFIRSDQYSFVKRGVVSVFPIAGYMDARGGSDANRAISDRWSVERYHRPADEWQPEYRAAWAAKEAGFDFLLGLSVATTAARPQWNAGDVFETTSGVANPDAGVAAR
jgi:Zn-dependent M28 family amino/carboxypeptidase